MCSSPVIALDPAASAPAQASTFSVLVVEDHETTRRLLVKELQQAGVGQVLEAGRGDEALALFRAHRPDLVLLDVVLPEQDGYWVAQQMRGTENGGGWTPIIFLSARDSDLDLWRGIEAGGDDYLTKPVKPIVLRAKLHAMRRLVDMRRRLTTLSEELHTANRQLNQMAEHDALTGLLNRRGFDRVLHQEIAAGCREGTPLTLMLCDLDYFKAYNDRLGHVQGDVCLQQISRLLNEVCARPRDVAARYGGEEFALILPNTPRSGAMTFARALAEVLRRGALPHPDSSLGGLVTLSGGITTCVPGAGTSAEAMVMRADEALYAAKAQGRNRFFSFEMQMDTLEQRQH
ncbi:diguanylate cyclase [Xylophilus sp. GW821-FHT01B05]